MLWCTMYMYMYLHGDVICRIFNLLIYLLRTHLHSPAWHWHEEWMTRDPRQAEEFRGEQLWVVVLLGVLLGMELLGLVVIWILVLVKDRDFFCLILQERKIVKKKAREHVKETRVQKVQLFCIISQSSQLRVGGS